LFIFFSSNLSKENIRKSAGPPSESDWWVLKDPPELNTKKSSIFCPMSSLSTSKKNADSCTTDSSNSTSSQLSSATRDFQNYGLSMWKESRKKWRAQTVSSRPSPPPPVNGDEVILGLSQIQRTYELPGRMRLSAAVELLVEIWECDRDY